MIKVEIGLSDEQVMSLLVTAFEGGSNYWIKSVDVAAPKGGHVDVAMFDDLLWPKFATAPLQGGKVEVRVDDEESVFILDLPAIHAGSSLCMVEKPNMLVDILSGNDDADTADCFLQFCLFGEIVYG